MPGRKLWGFLVEAKAKPGVLSRISNIPSKHNAVILYIAYSTPNPAEKTVKGLGFVDMTDADISAEELADEMLKIRAVRDVKVIPPPIDGFVADTLSPILQVMGDRVIMLRKPAYKGLISGVRKRFGSGGEAFLYYAGFDSGLEYGESHREIGAKLGLIDPETIFKKISTSLCNSVGFGQMEVVGIDTLALKATVRVYNSFECELGLGSGRPYSFFLRGILAGVLTALFNRKMKAEETKCIAKGDPYCEFIVKAEK